MGGCDITCVASERGCTWGAVWVVFGLGCLRSGEYNGVFACARLLGRSLLFVARARACDARGFARIAALALCVARVRRRRAAWPGMWPRVAAARAATSRGCSGARCGRVCVCCAKLELWQMCRAEWCAMAAGGVSLARAECARRCRVRTRVRERRTVARAASRCRVRRVTREEA